jgi:exodeoxyribonuclease VII large subunit
MSVHYRTQDQNLLIIGHTYPHKETIKALGARFNSEHKVWNLPNTEANRANVDALCRNLGGGCLDVDGIESSAPVTIAPQLIPVATTIVAPAPLGLSVSQLMHKLHHVISDSFASPIWIIGEIQNFAGRGSGMFFNLAEPKQDASETATISVKATLWRSVLANITAKSASLNKVGDLLADGMKVRLLCQVGLYRDRGAISLNVLDIDPNFTKGELALAREALLAYLRASGLDQKNKQTTLTDFPFRVGLISAEGSRAKSDFLDQLQSYHFCGDVLFFHAPMQGEKLVAEVIRGIEALTSADCDMIVITRGGGSAADLRWFDAKEVALAIADCSVPVIAAIGHHEDVCVAEEICFLRQKTPTAAADFVIQCFAQTQRRIEELLQVLADTTFAKIEAHNLRLQSLSERLVHNAELKFGRWREALLVLAAKINQSTQARFALYNEQLFKLEKQLTQLDPRPWLKQGFVQLKLSKQTLTRASDAVVGGKLEAQFYDGKLILEVLEKSATRRTT